MTADKVIPENLVSCPLTLRNLPLLHTPCRLIGRSYGLQRRISQRQRTATKFSEMTLFAFIITFVCIPYQLLCLHSFMFLMNF